MEFKTAYGKKSRVKIDFLDENGEQEIGRTEQCHKNECDINNVLKKYDRDGLITHINNAVAEYGDYTEINEYQESLNMVISAQESFNELPSKVRKEFGYNPGLFLEFATNPKNKEKLIDMGLAEKPIVIEKIIQDVRIIDDKVKEV